MQDVAQIVFPRKAVSTGNSLLQTFQQSLTPHALSTHSTSCERSRLHRVLLNCGSADRGTSGTSVNMQISSRCALGEI